MEEKKPLDIEEAKRFVESYCGPGRGLEEQAKQVAWRLYTELQKTEYICPKCKEQCEHKRCSKCGAPVEEEKVEEAVEEQTEDTAEEAVEEPTELEKAQEKVSELVEADKGDQSYFQYTKKQFRTLGTAGVIALCSAVYAQVNVVKDNGSVVYSVIDKEYRITDWVQKFLAPIIGSKATAAITESIDAEVDESAEVPQPVNPSKTTEVDPPND